MDTTNFSYVVDGVLAASARPYTRGGPTGSEDDLTRFAREGICGVVSLTVTPLSAEAVRRAGLEYLHLPVNDFSAPSLETVDRFVDFVRRVSAERGAVLVHCNSGCGRSGTLAACFLVSEGRTASEAIGEIRRLRPGSIETDPQEDAVHEWAENVSPRRHGDTEDGAEDGRK